MAGHVKEGIGGKGGGGVPIDPHALLFELCFWIIRIENVFYFVSPVSCHRIHCTRWATHFFFSRVCWLGSRLPCCRRSVGRACGDVLRTVVSFLIRLFFCCTCAGSD